MKIVLVAEESAGAQALRLVAGSPHEIHSVLTTTTTLGGRLPGPAAAARDLGLPVRPADLVRDPVFADELRRDEVDLLLNVHSLHLIERGVLEAPTIGCLNLHPGPLPQYAGLNVPSWAIYHGATTHGVTLHWMVPRIDAGPIAYAETFPLTESDTGLSLSVSCARRGVLLISRLLDDLTTDPDRIPRVPQDARAYRYHGRGVPGSGHMDWSASAKQIVDLVRACDYGPWPSPWGRARTTCGGTEITVGRARRTGDRADAPPGTVIALDQREAWIAAADECVAIGGIRVAGVTVPPTDVFHPGAVLTRTG